MNIIHGLPVCESVGKRVDPQAKLPYRVLVVEDDIDIRLIDAEVLQRSGYLVDTAEDGEAGWKALHEATNTPNCYHLLITDCNMPRLTGLDLIKRLRAAHIKMPVIMATGTFPEEEFNRLHWLQPAALLLKPYSISELIDTAGEMLFADSANGKQAARLQKYHSPLSSPL